MLRSFALIMTLTIAAGLMLVGGLCACGGEFAATEQASAATTASKDGCCCDCEQKDGEQDKSPCDCGSPDCPMTSGDEPASADMSELAVVSDRELEFAELAPQSKMLVIAWFAESLQNAAADLQVASSSYESPPPDPEPTYLTLQVLRI